MARTMQSGWFLGVWHTTRQKWPISFVQWSNAQLFGERCSERNDLGSFPVLVGMTLILGKNIKRIMYPTVLRQKTRPQNEDPNRKTIPYCRIHGSDWCIYLHLLPFYGKCKYSSPMDPMDSHQRETISFLLGKLLAALSTFACGWWLPRSLLSFNTQFGSTLPESKRQVCILKMDGWDWNFPICFLKWGQKAYFSGANWLLVSGSLPTMGFITDPKKHCETFTAAQPPPEPVPRIRRGLWSC